MRAVIEKRVHELRVTLHCCEVERSAPHMVAHVHAHSEREQRTQRTETSALRRHEQRHAMRRHAHL